MDINTKFYSQANQDRWVCEIFKNKKGGFFLDLGAMDGVQYSNTYTLEKELNWSGICVEASTPSFQQLSLSRESINVHAAVTNYNGTCFADGDGPCVTISSTGVNEVNCFTLGKLLEDTNAPKEIDYLSIDIEGEEYNVLSCFDFDKWFIKTITLEHNLYVDGPKNKDLLHKLLTEKGFIRVIDNVVCLDRSPHVYNQPYEDWYVNSKCEDILNDVNSRVQPINKNY